MTIPIPTTELDALFERWNQPGSPGCAVGVLADGALAYERYFGQASLEFGVPIGPDTRFQVASVSKQFVAAGLHLLALEGRLTLDDEVQVHIPELPRYPWPITLRQLVHHTSGLREEGQLHWFRGGVLEGMDNAYLLRLIARQRGLNFPPGSAHAYCNSGYTLLAEVIQRVSGQTLRAFTAERIFGPLGMTASLFDDDHTAVVPRRAESYSLLPGGGYARQVKTYNAVGAGGMLTTLRDLCRWDANFYAPVVGGRPLVDNLLARGRLNDGQSVSYASGLSHGQYRGLPLIRHGGMILGFRAQMIRFPAQRFTAIILANVNPFNPTRLIEQIADLCLAEHFPEPPVSLDPGWEVPPGAFEDRLGAYYDSETGAAGRLSVRQGSLWVEALGGLVPLAPLARQGAEPSSFRSLDGPPLTFEVQVRRPAPGQPYQLQVQAEMHTLPLMTQVEVAPPSLTELVARAGEYVNDELETGWRFELTRGRLHGGLPNGPYGELIPGPPGVMLLQGITLIFEPDACAFTLMEPRARHIRFEKTNRGNP